MPAVSLVVCVYKQRDLLERLLREAAGCYDDLVVVHDGPENTAVVADDTESGDGIPSHRYPEMAVDFSDPVATSKAAHLWIEKTAKPLPGSIHELVTEHGGRFFEGPRSYTHEPHWPFAWSACKNEWVLLWDADEFPSPELKTWLGNFRSHPASPSSISGYTCIWPLWDGRKSLSSTWPAGRLFMIDREKIRYFGMGEARPFPDAELCAIPFVLHHQPKRKSYGIRNILFRHHAYLWRRAIAQSLMDSPTKLPRWRWNSSEWPASWEATRRRPLRHALISLFWFPLCQVRGMLRAGELPRLSACLNPGLHHFMLGVRIWMEKSRNARQRP